MDILGMDEAGRGSVLGPMVIAGVIVPEKMEKAGNPSFIVADDGFLCAPLGGRNRLGIFPAYKPFVPFHGGLSHHAILFGHQGRALRLGS